MTAEVESKSQTVTTTDISNNSKNNNNNSIDSLRALAKQYIEWEPCELFRDQVAKALSANNEQLLSEMFANRISFGTAGLRSKMYGGYANMNDLIIIQTTQGIIRYMESFSQTQSQSQTQSVDNDKHRGVVIGYDGRYHSERFCQISLSIFLHSGYKVHWFNRMAATPLIPFAILQLSCVLGIVVTASHNPKADNGFKVYWRNGAQIIPPHDVGISAQIQQNLQPWITSVEELNDVQPFNLQKHNIPDQREMSVDVTEVITNAYFKAVAETCAYNRVNNSSLQLKVTFTPMHGVGGYWMTQAYKACNLPAFIPVKAQFEPDPEFSTVEFPNPEEGAGALKLAIETAEANESPLILANDPDSDRLAVAELIDGEWRIYNGNEIATLLADYIFVNHMRLHPDCDKSKLCMLASTVSSKYLQSMATKEGFQFFDTLTGFKWLGNKAIECKENGFEFLLAYEVEIGFLIGTMSFDKDGLRAGTVFHEMAALLYTNGQTCASKLHDLRSRYGFFEMTAGYRRMTDELVFQKMNRLRTGFTNNGSSNDNDNDNSNVSVRENENGNDNNNGYPSSMGAFEICRIRDITTGYDSGEPDLKSLLPMQPTQHMITFWFSNGATATIRNSGTEPKLKFYVETSDEKDANTAKLLLTEMTAALMSEFMQME